MSAAAPGARDQSTPPVRTASVPATWRVCLAGALREREELNPGPVFAANMRTLAEDETSQGGRYADATADLDG